MNKDMNTITVRPYSGTYIAKFRKSVASCTCGPQQAAEAVARKVMGSKPYSLHRIGTENVWRVCS
jgi:hypothetical protein